MLTDILLSLSLIALIVLGTRSVSNATHSRAALYFALYCYIAAAITLIELMAHYAPNEGVARSWGQVAAVWPLAWVFYAQFSVQSAGNPRYGRWLIGISYAAAATIAGSYFVLAGRGDVVAPAPDFGFALESPFVNSPLGIVVAVCYTLIPGITIVVLARAALQSDARSRKRQLRWIFAAYGAGFLAGVGLVLLREVGSVPVREVNGFSYFITATIIYVGIARKHLVYLTPEFVARDVLDQIDECFVLTDDRYRIVTMNAAAARTFGRSRASHDQLDWYALVGRDSSQASDGDVAVCRDTGEELTLAVSTSETRNHLGEIVGRVFVGRDVTRERQREAALRDLLDEKNVVLKELHHRVKNTLQMIDGLVSLKTSRLTSPDAVAVFRTITSRISLIGHVYNEVYAQDGLHAIRLDWALRTLWSMHTVGDSGRADVTVDLAVEDVSLSVEIAIPVLLAVAELVENAFQHAYGSGGSGAVRLRCECVPDGRWVIVVSDDGTGIRDAGPADALGLVLVQSLMRQVGGSAELLDGPGTTWRLTLP